MAKAWAGQAAGKRPEDFCKLFGLKMSGHFAEAELLEDHCMQLAEAWNSRMQFLFNLGVAAGELEDHIFQEADLGGV